MPRESGSALEGSLETVAGTLRSANKMLLVMSVLSIFSSVESFHSGNPRLSGITACYAVANFLLALA